jgi:ketosteroid isomerase-like protein
VTAVRRLADEIAVRDVVLGYARAVDRKDLDAVGRCFTADCAYEGALASGTIADALATLGAAFARYARTMHFMGTQDVTVDGDAAEAVTYCVAYHVRTNGRHATVAVRYLDTLARTPDGWRIARRAVRTDWTRDDPPAPPA